MEVTHKLVSAPFRIRKAGFSCVWGRSLKAGRISGGEHGARRPSAHIVRGFITAHFKMAQTGPNNAVVAEKVDEEVMRLADQNVFASNWATPLNATPVAITLLGECMITACMESAYLININGPSIPYVSE
jgi:hypothetical protein